MGICYPSRRRDVVRTLVGRLAWVMSIMIFLSTQGLIAADLLLRTAHFSNLFSWCTPHWCSSSRICCETASKQSDDPHPADDTDQHQAAFFVFASFSILTGVRLLSEVYKPLIVVDRMHGASSPSSLLLAQLRHTPAQQHHEKEILQVERACIEPEQTKEAKKREAEVARQLREQRRREEEARRKAEEEERRRQRVQAVLQSGQHEGRFYALSGDPIYVTVQTQPNVKPTARDWTKVLAREHFLCPSFRWVILWEDDDFLDDGAVLMFCDQIEGEERVINALQKVVPELIDLRGATREQLESQSREVILRAVEKYPSGFYLVPERFRADREIAEVAVEQYGHLISDVAGSLRSDRELLMISLKKGSRKALPMIPPEFLDDPEVLELVKRAWHSDISLLEYLPLHFRSDEDTIITAIGGAGGFHRDWLLVDEDLQRSRPFVLRAIVRNPEILQFCIDEFRWDREVVEAAIKATATGSCARGSQRPVLQWASEELQNDRELVLSQVRKAGDYLDRTRPKWLEDAEIVQAALRNFPAMVSSCHGIVLDDPVFMLDMLKVHGFGRWGEIVHSEKLQRDRDFALKTVREAAIGSSGFLSWGFTPTWWLDDEEIVRTVLGRRGQDLRSISETLRTKRDIVEIAVNQNGAALEFAAEYLRDDRDLVLLALRRHGNALEFASENLRDDREVVLEAVRLDGKALQFASSRLRADREVVLVALQKSAEAFHFVDEKLRLEDDSIKETARMTVRGIRNCWLGLQT